MSGTQNAVPDLAVSALGWRPCRCRTFRIAA